MGPDACRKAPHFAASRQEELWAGPLVSGQPDRGRTRRCRSRCRSPRLSPGQPAASRRSAVPSSDCAFPSKRSKEVTRSSAGRQYRSRNAGRTAMAHFFAFPPSFLAMTRQQRTRVGWSPRARPSAKPSTDRTRPAPRGRRQSYFCPVVEPRGCAGRAADSPKQPSAGDAHWSL